MQTYYEITRLSTTTRAANTTHSEKLHGIIQRKMKILVKKTLDTSPSSELIC